MAQRISLIKGAHPSHYSGVNTDLVVARTSSDTPPDFFNVSQALFACLSVVVGVLALIVGLLQLRRYRRRQELDEKNCVFELEAGLPVVRVTYICSMRKDS
jgi:hypothetical protein